MKYIRKFLAWLFLSPCQTQLSEQDRATIRRITEEAKLITQDTNYLKGIRIPDRRKEKRE